MKKIRRRPKYRVIIRGKNEAAKVLAYTITLRKAIDLAMLYNENYFCQMDIREQKKADRLIMRLYAKKRSEFEKKTFA
jgi:hypothetical protein